MKNSMFFFNRCFDKTRLKNFILWFFNKHGASETILLIENLKKIGFEYATKTGISLGIDDLKIPLIKAKNILNTEEKVLQIEASYKKGNITEIERKQQFVEEWNFASENLKISVVQFFKATNIFNPIYMIAFSGARGNISQVRQLIGMRGLMVDPQGQILEFPIRSNFREGLNLTEYIISCYGARKGVVDTALRTATSGYLTRRLVDVTQQVIIGKQNCQTVHGIKFTSLMDGTKTLLTLKDRLIGRVLLNDFFDIHPITKQKIKVASKNQEISSRLSIQISRSKKSVFLRSPLCCISKNFICQLCYGWSLANSTIVSIGEAVGVLAAQSIGEPGTQLTMRTFHTGGVFTGGFIDQIYAPFNGKVKYLDPFYGKLIRTLNGKIGFLAKTKGRLKVQQNKIFYSKLTKKEFKKTSLTSQLYENIAQNKNIFEILSQVYEIESQLNFTKNIPTSFLIFNTPIYTTFLVRNGEIVNEKNLIAEFSSPSFFENRQQETEQEIFAPTSGQIFFDNLVLIEKTNKEGITQKLTYGLGSIWLISGFFLNSFFNENIFPIPGDFIEFNTTSQKFKVLIERPYHIDFKLFNLSQKLNHFKNHQFSLNQKPFNFHSQFDLLDTIFLNRPLFSINFKKVYYLKHRYFIITNLSFLEYNLNLLNYIKFLIYLPKKNKLNFSQKNHELSLNFSFFKKKKEISISNKKINSKVNFLIYNELRPSFKFNKTFFYEFKNLKNIKTKLRYPIISRKNKLFNKKNKVINNYFWFKYIDSNIFQKNSFNFYNWSYYSKKSNLDPRFNVGIKNLFKVKTNINNLKFQESETIKILKNFLKFFNPKNFRLIFTDLRRNKLEKKFHWISSFQTFFILLNRQGLLNFELLNSYEILNNLKIKKSALLNPQNNKNFEKIINKNPFFLIFKKNVREDNVFKPIFINWSPLKSRYPNQYQFHLDCYIVEYFLYSYKKKNYLALLANNKKISSYRKQELKIGYKVLFRTNLVPYLKNQNENFIDPVSLKNFIFNKPHFEKILNSIFQYRNRNQIKLNSKKTQTLLSWICFPSNFDVLKNSNKVLLTGEFFQNGVRFDNKNIFVNIVSVNRSYFVKDNFKQKFNFYWINNSYSRFCKKVKIISNLILFEMLLLNRESNFKNKFLNNCFSNQIFLKLLIFNINKNSYNRIKKKHFQPTKITNPFNFHSQILELNNRIFLKSQYLDNIKVSLSLESTYYIFLSSYFTISKKYNFNYTFKNLTVKDHNLTNYIFNEFDKHINVSFLKKFNFKIFKNQIHKNANLLKVFCSNLDPFCFKSLLHIKFFVGANGAEVIQADKMNKKFSFILINQSNLRKFSFHKSFLKIKNEHFNIGNFIRYGSKINHQKYVTESGQIIYIDDQKLILRKSIPFLITARSVLNVSQNEIVNKNARLFKFLYHQIKTGDIIQGIPKIEEFFEARITRSGAPILANLHFQLKQLFREYRKKFSISEATQKSFEIIQRIIIDEIQKIYCSQGIFISDKHLEIVVRQMTSKVQIHYGGQTGLLAGELIEFNWARLINSKLDKKEIFYEPIVLGITKSCLETESFISAASFQETTRILSKAAVQNKIDFVRGLKQNVILGSLIPAGTGFLSPLYFKDIKD